MFAARWLLFIATLAGLSPALATPARRADQVLILNLQGNVTLGDKARAALRDRLAHMGEPAQIPSLSATEQSCRSNECLESLARHHDAARLLGGEVQENDHSYLIKLWLLTTATQELRTETGSCEICSPDDLLGALAVTAGRLLQPPAAAPPSAPPFVANLNAPAIGKPLLPTWRKALAGGLGGAAAASLITAIVLTVKNGAASGACAQDGWLYESCHNNFTAGSAVAYSAAGLATVGVILSLTLPTGTKEGAR